MIFKTFQTRGQSAGGSGTAQFDLGGFNPGQTVYLSLIGWSFRYTYGHHSVEEIGIWSQQAIPGGYEWANEFRANEYGHVIGQFYAFLNDDNDDNPFTFLINALLIGV
jgi:hypothetical protein